MKMAAMDPWLISIDVFLSQDRDQRLAEKFANTGAEKKTDSQARADEAKLRGKAWAAGKAEDMEGWKKFAKLQADKGKQRMGSDKMMDVGGIEDGEEHRHLQSFRPGATLATAAHQHVGLEKGIFTAGRRYVGKLGTNFGGLLTGSSWTGGYNMAGEEEAEEGARHLGAEQPCDTKAAPSDDRVWSMKPFAEGQASRVEAKQAMTDRWGRLQQVGEFEANYFTQWAIARGWIPEPANPSGRRLDAMDDRMAAYKEKGEWWAEFGKQRAADAKGNAQENGYMHEDKNKNKQRMKSKNMAAGIDNDGEDDDVAKLSGFFTGNLDDPTISAPESVKAAKAAKQAKLAAAKKAEASIDPSGNQQTVKPMMMPPDDVHDGKKFR